MNDLLTIKEFSATAGISQQTVYKQLKGRLLPYLEERDGKKYIKSAALTLYSTELNNQLNNQLKRDNPVDIMDSEGTIQPSVQPIQPDIQPNNDELELVKNMVQTLQRELDRKEAALLEERQRVNDLNDKLAAAYQQIAEMGKAAQFITAADKTVKLTETQVSPFGSAATQEDSEADDGALDRAQTMVEKKSFIGKLLSRFK